MSQAVDKVDLARRYRSGVTLAAERRDMARFRVVAVTSGSPGAELGLEKDDLIVEVDARACGEFSLEEMRQFFRTDGRRILTVERGGKRRKVTFELGR